MTFPRVLCLTTGGTIASAFDEAQGGLVASIEARDLVSSVPEVCSVCELETIELASVSSTWLDIEQTFRWAQELGERLADPAVAGAVIVTGTETLEEVAYLFDLVLAHEKPVAFTGAARTSAEQPSDGPRNLVAAAAVAAGPAARGLGVVVVFADEIHAAREATKLHANSLTAFASPGAGPLGAVRRGLGRTEIVVRRRPAAREHIATSRIEPAVTLAKATLGADGAQIDGAIAEGARGLVLETFPAGGITPAMAAAVDRAFEADVVVVAASRAPGTLLTDVYGGVGEGRWLLDRGVLFADDISAPKARIKLMLLLGLEDRSRVATHFDRGGR